MMETDVYFQSLDYTVFIMIYSMLRLTLGSLLLAVTMPRAPVDDLARIRANVDAGRYAIALRDVDERLEKSDRAARLDLLQLRAHCLFGLGSYRECENALKTLLDEFSEDARQRLTSLVRLARVQAAQGGHEDALDTIHRALEVGRPPAVLQQAVMILLQGRRYDKARPLAEEWVRKSPGDPLARVRLGVSLAKTGELEGALEELAHGFDVAAVSREARFEAALALGKLGRPREALDRLLPILERDPYDAEACFQTSRQLLGVGGPAAARTASQLTKYFQGLRATRGEDSDDHHLEAQGRLAEAAVLRAAKWEKLGDFERSLQEIRRTLSARPQSGQARLYLAGFWLRRGLYAECEAELDAISKDAKGDAALEESIALLAKAIRKSRLRLLDKPESPAARLRRRLASTRWSESGPVLSKVLAGAAELGERDLVDTCARLLLARDPGSTIALRHLLARTAHPSLLVPRLHYLERLARAEPDEALWKELRGRARKTFSGTP